MNEVMSPRVTVVAVDALSYSGTTWLNLVLGSHEKAFTLGPPHRIWGMKDKGFEGANLVWGDKDTFWKGFDEGWDRKENFLVALADYANVSHIVFDNPSAEFRAEVMSDPRIHVKSLRYFRDGRAITASYKRRNPHVGYLDSILPSGWLYHSFMGTAACKVDKSEQSTFHYEGCHADPLGFLERAGEFIGLHYADSALRFWEWDHHITSGNQGPIAFLKLAKRLPVQGMDFYKKQFERMQDDPLHGFSDERWRNDLTREDLFLFDLILGRKNASHGYERDRFSIRERTSFMLRNYDRIAPHRMVWDKIPANVRGPLYGPAKRIVSTMRAVRRLTRKVQSATPAEESANSSQDVILLDELDYDRLQHVRPYIAVESHLPYETIKQNVNRNFYLSYGPDYTLGGPGKVCVDPLVRYRQLLEAMRAVTQLEFLTAAELVRKKPQPGKVLAHLRHDVDGDLVAALAEARIEQELGIRSTFYILHTAPYYGRWNATTGRFERNEAAAEAYCEIQSLGHEVGLHTDALLLYQTYGVDGASALEEEIEWLRSRGINLIGSVSHNSVSTYGAVNYAIFEGRPVSFTDRRSKKGVIKGNRWAPLQVLDESQLNLQYEGNDLFWQEQARVEYFCLMRQNEWYYQVFENGAIRRKSAAEAKAAWITQEDVIRQVQNVDRPCYVMLSVHPMHYGLRHAETSAPPLKAQVDLPKMESKKQGWIGFRGNADFAFAEGAGEYPECQSIIRTNGLGMLDVPLSSIENCNHRILFLGRNNVHAEMISVASKVSQALRKIFLRRSGKDVGVTSLAGPDVTSSILASWFASIDSMRAAFDLIVLSVGADDIVLQDPELFASLWGLSNADAERLFPTTISEESLKALRGTAFESSIKPNWSDVHSQRVAAFFDKSDTVEWTHATARLMALVAFVKSRGPSVVLLIEDCGEKAGLWTQDTSLERKRELHAITRDKLSVLADAMGVQLADPYERFLNTGRFAPSHWSARPEWSLHGHMQAAEAVFEAAKCMRTEQAPIESDA